MPGIVGFTIAKDRKSTVDYDLDSMTDTVTHNDCHTKNPRFIDSNVAISCSYLDVLPYTKQPLIKEGKYFWFEGELFNQDKLASGNHAGITDIELMADLWLQDNTHSFLARVDGIFAFVVYDPRAASVSLVSDRYGIKHIYLAVVGGALVWSSEMKAVLEHLRHTPKIDEIALEQFMRIGHFIGSRTWFDNIKLLDPATVLTYDIREGVLETSRYWFWDRIKPATRLPSEGEIIEELGRLFKASVARRCHLDKRIGLFLSGGLDSRAILAAIPPVGYQIGALTFGKKNSLDARIAEVAAGRKGANHVFYELNARNWITPRISGVWWTDGQLDLKHMHGIESLLAARRIFDVNLNGFWGDRVLHGTTIKDASMQDTSDEMQIAKAMGCEVAELENVGRYTNLGKVDYYVLENRSRRFIALGPKCLQVLTEQRMPYCDNDLVEFSYSLPDTLRSQARIFEKMLLKEFPEYFRWIRYQKTGVPISFPDQVVRMAAFTRKATNRLRRELKKIKVQIPDNRGYTDYPNWLRQSPARDILQDILLAQDALYVEYIPRENVTYELHQHMAGKDNSDSLCRYLTMEIWLRQVVDGRYKPLGPSNSFLESRRAE